MVKVLLADDEYPVQKMVERRLEANGYEVIVASNGEQALQLARERQPDVIVMDILMPKISGDEVAGTLHKDDRTSHIPIIFLTCLLQPGETTEPNFVVGKDIVLSKPINSARLLETIKKVVGR